MSHEEFQQQHHSAEMHEEGEEGEPWLVSYADMMTLLFGFFVLMYTFASAKLQDDSDQWIRIKKELAAFFGGEENQKRIDKNLGDSKELFSPNVGIEVGNQAGKKSDSKGIFEQPRDDVESEVDKDNKYILSGTYVSPGSDLSDSEIQSILDLKKLADSEKSLELIISNNALFKTGSKEISERGHTVIKNICRKLSAIPFPYFLGVTSFSQSEVQSSKTLDNRNQPPMSPPSLLTFERSSLLVNQFSKCTVQYKNKPMLSAMGVGYVPKIKKLKGVLSEGVILRVSITPE
jgi:flagellar motor protein MotB